MATMSAPLTGPTRRLVGGLLRNWLGAEIKFLGRTERDAMTYEDRFEVVDATLEVVNICSGYLPLRDGVEASTFDANLLTGRTGR